VRVLQVSVGGNLLDQVCQIECFAQVGIDATVNPRERQQLPDQLVKTIRLESNAVQVFGRFVSGALPQQTQRHNQT